MRAHDKENLFALLSDVADAFKPKSEVRLYAIGGTALTILGLKESTMDIDFLLEGWDQLHNSVARKPRTLVLGGIATTLYKFRSLLMQWVGAVDASFPT